MNWKGIGRSRFWPNRPFEWKNWVSIESLRMTGIPANIRIHHLPNTRPLSLHALLCVLFSCSFRLWLWICYAFQTVVPTDWFVIDVEKLNLISSFSLVSSATVFTFEVVTALRLSQCVEIFDKNCIFPPVKLKVRNQRTCAKRSISVISGIVMMVVAWTLKIYIFQSANNGSGAHPDCYSVGVRGAIHGGKAAGAWSWPLTSIYFRG